MKFKNKNSGEIADFWNWSTGEPIPDWLIHKINQGIFDPRSGVYLTKDHYQNSNLWYVFEPERGEFYGWDLPELLNEWEPVKK